MGGVTKVAMFLSVKTDKYSGLCEQEHYGDEAFMGERYGSPMSVKARKSKLKVKVMLIVFFNIQDIVHFKFLPQGQTVNQTVFKDILRCLVRSVHDKRQILWEAHAWMLHQNNASAHTAMSICQFLAERSTATLVTPP